MLWWGAVKRVERALLGQLDAGEHLEASALGRVPLKGDFAIGRTGARLIWVGVTKFTGKPNGKVFLDDIQCVRLGRGNIFYTPIRRCDGSVFNLKVERAWAERMWEVFADIAPSES